MLLAMTLESLSHPSVHLFTHLQSPVQAVTRPVIITDDDDVFDADDEDADDDDELDDEEPVVGAAVDRLATSSLGDDAQAQSTTATATTKRPDVTRGRIRSTQLRPGETTRPPSEHRTPPGGRSRGPSPA